MMSITLFSKPSCELTTFTMKGNEAYGQVTQNTAESGVYEYIDPVDYVDPVTSK